MAFITDFEQIVDCNSVTGLAYSNWEPTLCNSTHNSPNYIENSACMFWPLSKGVTDGYGSFSAGNESMSGKILVGFIMQTLADIGNIPVTELQLRFSSAAALATNFAAWNVLTQIVSPFNAPVSGLVPIICHENNTVETGGTPNYSSIGYVGYMGTTGNNNDGKQGWFDHFFVISYVGEESADYSTTPNTFFDRLADEAYDSNGAGGNTVPDQDDRPLGIFTKDGDSYTSNVSVQIGSGSGDTAISVKETGKTVKWNNVHANHHIGYIFKDPATGDSDAEMTNITNIWAIKQSATAEIFTTPENAVDWKWDGCVFTRGGKGTFPAYGATRYMKNSKFTDSGIVTPKDCVFEDTTVEDQTIGVLITGALTNNRMKRTTYIGCDDALKIDTVQNITLDGDKFSGNTYDIWFSGNCSTITAGSFTIGRAYKILTVGTTDFTAIGAASNTIGVKFVATGVGTGTGTATEVLLINATNGANPSTSRSTGTNGDVLINNPIIHKLTGLQPLSDVTYTVKPQPDVAGLSGQTTIGTRTFTDTGKSWTINEHKGKLLLINYGTYEVRCYIASNTATTLTVDTIFDSSDTSLSYNIYGAFDVVAYSDSIPASGEFEYAYNYSSDEYVDILITHVDYEPIEILDAVLGSTDQTLPIAQRFDVNYFNPT